MTATHTTPPVSGPPVSGTPDSGTTDPALDPAPGVRVTSNSKDPHVSRRAIDTLLIAIGALTTVALAIAGALLARGASFAGDYVHDELTAQKIVFPPADSLAEEGRDDLVSFGGRTVDTGDEAEAYASFIDGHLVGIADGATYAELGTPEREARAAVTEATDAGQPQATIDQLQATADEISTQRNTLFKGEALRGLLLTAYAWSTVGQIAGFAAIAAFAAAALMALLVGLGLVHRVRLTATT
jgi:hypothetical protein